jgi:hypothetical protein
MKHLKAVVAVALCVGLMAWVPTAHAVLHTPADGPVVADLVPGVVNQLEDNDLDEFVTGGTVTVGDPFVVKGWIQGVFPSNTSYDSTTAAFTYTAFGSVTSITPTGTGSFVLESSDIVVSVYDDPIVDPIGNPPDDGDGPGGDAGVHADEDVGPPSVADATNGTLLYTFGVVSPTNFFASVVNSLTEASITVFQFSGDLDLTGPPSGGAPSLDLFEFLGNDNPFDLKAPGPAHLELTGANASVLDKGAWDFATDGDFYIKPTGVVPEASSVAIWLLSFGGLGAVVTRIRRRAA